MKDVIKVLEDFALANYESGGHWIFECWSADEYLEALTEGGSIDNAKKVMQDYWELINEQEKNCAW